MKTRQYRVRLLVAIRIFSPFRINGRTRRGDKPMDDLIIKSVDHFQVHLASPPHLIGTTSDGQPPPRRYSISSPSNPNNRTTHHFIDHIKRSVHHELGNNHLLRHLCRERRTLPTQHKRIEIAVTKSNPNKSNHTPSHHPGMSLRRQDDSPAR